MAFAINSRILRTISLLITIFSLTLPAHAKYSGGTGEPNEPYRIATAEDLMLLGDTPEDYDKHFILTADIDLDPNLPGRKVFYRAVIAPYDNETESDFQGTPFVGVFDGNDNTIRHLTIQSDGTRYLGLFGRIASAGSIRNLHLKDFHVSSSSSYVGGLVGYTRGNITKCHLSGSVSGGTGEWCSYLGLMTGSNSGTIIECTIEGSISSGSTKRGSRIGFLAGMNRGAISCCDAKGTVTAEGLFFDIGGLVGENLNNVADCHTTCSLIINVGSDYGGLVGSNRGIINRCYATGNISFGEYSDDTGGLVGYNSGSIIGCYASGNVFGAYSTGRLGGLVGWNWGNIINCFCTGSVNGSRNVGGLIGENRGSITHCYSTGSATGYNTGYNNIGRNIGGLVGDSSNGDVTFSFWDTETSGLTKSGKGTGLETIKMQEIQTFLEAGWDFVSERPNGTSDLWRMPEGDGYPMLTFFSEGYLRRELPGSGTLDDPYLVATDEDLGAMFHYDISACYRLVADVNLAGITWKTPVIPVFDGTFDGNGFTISNLTIHGGDGLGLFGALEKHAVVENLGIQDANIVGGSSASNLGILAVENWGRIANCQITGNVSGEQYEEQLGGIVGYNLGTITDCDPIDYDGPYSVIITDLEATREFLMFEGIDFGQVLIPEEADLEGLDSILKAYLDPDMPVQVNTWIDNEYILDNFHLYEKEYSGFILNDSKYIICQMIFWSGFQGSCFIAEYDPGSKFTIIFDGGCGVVRVIFDANSKAVISISCNGMA
jgi:hypothetical protein